MRGRVSAPEGEGDVLPQYGGSTDLDRMNGVLAWGRAMRRAAEEGDRREMERLTHWWDERVEGWAEEVRDLFGRL